MKIVLDFSTSSDVIITTLLKFFSPLGIFRQALMVLRSYAHLDISEFSDEQMQ